MRRDWFREKWLNGSWNIDDLQMHPIQKQFITYNREPKPMNYSFNADYREVAKRMQRHNSLRITSCSASIAFMAQLIKSYLKWPWC